MARPALAVGLSLALLETLNDIGASEFLGVHTLTVSVYTTWITRSDLAGAAQIACSMLLAVVALVWLERKGRSRQRFGSAQRMRGIESHRLPGYSAWLATLACSVPVLIGFVAPASYLAWESGKRFAQGSGISDGLVSSLLNTLGLAAGVTLIAVAAGLVVAWCPRSARRWGWCMPGALVAPVICPALVLWPLARRWVWMHGHHWHTSTALACQAVTWWPRSSRLWCWCMPGAGLVA